MGPWIPGPWLRLWILVRCFLYCYGFGMLRTRHYTLPAALAFSVN